MTEGDGGFVSTEGDEFEQPVGLAELNTKARPAQATVQEGLALSASQRAKSP